MLEPKLLYRRMEALLDRLRTRTPTRRFAERLVPALLEELGAWLPLTAVELYRREEGALGRVRHSGGETNDLAAELSRRFGDGTDPGGDLPWAGEIGGGTVVLFAVPDGLGSLVALRLAEPPEGGIAHLLPAVFPLHYALPHHLQRRALEDLLEQARTIQSGLLPSAPPAFEGFDMAARSVAANTVGGDFYDFTSLDADTIALAVADASGHGLPAALQARDVATGLRMGMERDLKIQRLIEKLNRIIHRSGPASHFVSLVFGELESNGNFSYINAGHPAPVLLDDGGTRELTVGGPLLGPYPESAYKLGFAHVDRGAALVLYSDGVIEHGTSRGEPFGSARLAEWLRVWREGPAEAAIGDLFQRLQAFGGGTAFEDDVTAVLVRRLR